MGEGLGFRVWRLHIKDAGEELELVGVSGGSGGIV